MKRNNQFYKEKEVRRQIDNNYKMTNYKEIHNYSYNKLKRNVMVDDRYCPETMRSSIEFISRLYSVNEYYISPKYDYDTKKWVGGYYDYKKYLGSSLNKIDYTNIHENTTYIYKNWDLLNERFHLEISNGIPFSNFYKFIYINKVKDERIEINTNEGILYKYVEVDDSYWEIVRQFPLDWLKYDNCIIEEKRTLWSWYNWNQLRSINRKLHNKYGKYYTRLEKPNKYKWETYDWYHNKLDKKYKSNKSTNSMLNDLYKEDVDYWKGYSQYRIEEYPHYDFYEDYLEWKNESKEKK